MFHFLINLFRKVFIGTPQVKASAQVAVAQAVAPTTPFIAKDGEYTVRVEQFTQRKNVYTAMLWLCDPDNGVSRSICYNLNTKTIPAPSTQLTYWNANKAKPSKDDPFVLFSDCARADSITKRHDALKVRII